MTEESRPESPQADDAGHAAAEPALPDAASLVATCITLLANKAWQAMGLVPDPATKTIQRRFEEAQLTIDAAAALADLLRSRVGDQERRELETLIANLRINFVEQKSKAT